MPPEAPLPVETLKYCFDIDQAAGRIRQFTAGKTLDDYQHDLMLQSAVERQFEIIGEAVSQLAKRDPRTADRIPEYRRLISFRNVLIHGYAEVDEVLVWGFIESHLPGLLTIVGAILAASPPS